MIHYFNRLPEPGRPGGVTVSKCAELPEGDFQIDEFKWDALTLWFVTEDEFTASERDDARRGFVGFA